MDEFYVEDLNQNRSSCYAVSKGLVSTAPGITVQPQNADNVDSKPGAVNDSSGKLDNGLASQQIKIAT